MLALNKIGYESSFVFFLQKKYLIDVRFTIFKDFCRVHYTHYLLTSKFSGLRARSIALRDCESFH